MHIYNMYLMQHLAFVMYYLKTYINLFNIFNYKCCVELFSTVQLQGPILFMGTLAYVTSMSPYS